MALTTMKQTQNNLSLILASSNEDASFEQKYLTFHLHKGFYAVPILKIQEIISMIPITPVPHVPAAIRGLMNLRGRVVSVLDLRKFLGLPISKTTSLTSIMVIRIQQANQTVTMGCIVDRVASVQDIPDEKIDPPPSYSNEVDISFAKGLAKIDNQVLMTLDIDKIIDGLITFENQAE